MTIVLRTPESAPPSTIIEILDALRKEGLDPRMIKKSWGDWIHLDSYETIISIEVVHGLSSSATIEPSEEETNEEPTFAIQRAFARLHWVGIDDDGEFRLD